jgi:hypothetical protein
MSKPFDMKPLLSMLIVPALFADAKMGFLLLPRSSV